MNQKIPDEIIQPLNIFEFKEFLNSLNSNIQNVTIPVDFVKILVDKALRNRWNTKTEIEDV